MTNNLSKLKKEAQNIRLSAHEKRAMHARIFGVPSGHVPSPYAFFFAFSYQRAFAFAMVLLVLVGSTTAYAAQGALPGEALYAVKVNLTEPISGTLAFSAQAKADYHVGLAERRMEEAETLASTGKLTASTTEVIEHSLAEHVAAADTLTNSLTEEDPGAAAEVSARFSSSLSAHGAILSRLGESSDNDDTKKNSGSLAMYVRDNVEGSLRRHRTGNDDPALAMASHADDSARMQTMSLAVSAADASATPQAKESAPAAQAQAEASSSKNAGSQRTMSSHLKDDAQDALEEARDAYEHAELDATTTAQVKDKLEEIGGSLNAGQQLLDAREYAQAQAKFTGVIEESVRLEALITANAKFDNDILRNLLWQRDDDKGSSWRRTGDDDQRDRDEEESGEDEGADGFRGRWDVHLEL